MSHQACATPKRKYKSMRIPLAIHFEDATPSLDQQSHIEKDQKEVNRNPYMLKYNIFSHSLRRIWPRHRKVVGESTTTTTLVTPASLPFQEIGATISNASLHRVQGKGGLHKYALQNLRVHTWERIDLMVWTHYDWWCENQASTITIDLHIKEKRTIDLK